MILYVAAFSLVIVWQLPPSASQLCHMRLNVVEAVFHAPTVETSVSPT